MIARKAPNPDDDIDLKIVLQHLSDCADSFVYFVTNFVQIQDKKTKRWIPFLLWSAQEQAADLMQYGGSLVILKTRQVGLSWLAAAYTVWSMLFDPIAEIVLFSVGLREATQLLERVKGIYWRLPAWMRSKAVTIDMKTEFKIANGSHVTVLPPGKGDSYAATLIIFDEADHVYDFAALYNRAAPAAEGGGKVFIISTSDKNRPKTLFKKIFRAAQKGLAGMSSLFIPYTAHPDRDEQWYEGKKDELRLQNGTDDVLHEKYPRTVDEALAGISLNKWFPAIWVDRAYEPVDPAFIVSDVYADEDKLPATAPAIPGLIVYDVPRPGGRYVIGIDGAEGGANSHDTAITVLDYDYLIEVAHLSGLITPTMTAVYVVELYHYFNQAFIMPERNNHGHAIIGDLLQHVPVMNGLDNKPGWLTGKVGKPRMYNWGHKVLSQRATVIRTEKTMLQLKDIDRATLKAPQNMLDDCADSYMLAIAGHMHNEANAGSIGLFDD